MSVWVYGVVEPGTRLPDVPGPAGAPLRLVRAGQVDAVVCDAPAEVPQELADLLAHERVVEALTEAGPVLPARYGSRLPDDAAVARSLEDGDRWLSALAAVRGRVELAVRAVERAGQAPPQAGAAPAPATAGTRPGHVYLARLAARSDVQTRLRDRVHAPLAEVAAAAVWRDPRGVDEPGRGSYLVDRGKVAQMQQLCSALAEEPGLTVTCTGPWPPYSFSTPGGGS
jgi:hypothetical protein